MKLAIEDNQLWLYIEFMRFQVEDVKFAQKFYVFEDRIFDVEIRRFKNKVFLKAKEYAYGSVIAHYKHHIDFLGV